MSGCPTARVPAIAPSKAPTKKDVRPYLSCPSFPRPRQSCPTDLPLSCASQSIFLSPFSCRSPKPGESDLPWTGMVFGLAINSIWYWCSDQVSLIVSD